MQEASQDDIRSMQSGQAPYESILRESLRAELRLVNTGLPRSRRRLSDLLKESRPHVLCNDGSTHSFKRRELEYLAAITDAAEQEKLLLPITIEVGRGEGESSILCEGEVEREVVTRILGMQVTCEQGRIRIYRPQLALLRGKLRTTTVYVFSAGVT